MRQPHFVCSGRHSERTECTCGAILIVDAEKLIEDYYQRIQIIPAHLDDANRRLCDQAFFTKVYIDEDDKLRVENNRPFETLLDP
ncbi:hypothetical protein [Kocuria sp. ZOR0020]|uniref:hypothetical protein n=1 Tax=Kocuria sp. ZOR0020 TaxID=1339234 RepID=UPI00068B1137|nr:hypothetical protein [Kocuria sp. ZOR0020]